MRDSLRIIFEHVARTLPAAPNQRELLQALSAVLPLSHPAHKNVEAILSAEELSDSMKRELPQLFSKSANHNKPTKE